MQVSVAPLVEVMRGETVTLDCTPLGDYGQYQLKWFLVSAGGWGPGAEGDLKARARGLQPFLPPLEAEGSYVRHLAAFPFCSRGN